MTASRFTALVLLTAAASTVAPSAVSAPSESARMSEAAARPASVRVVAHWFTTRDGARIPIDAYVPEAGAGTRPAVLYVHGGGWRNGSRTSFALGRGFAPTARRLVRAGFAVFSVGYRLAPEHRFPAGANDVSDAIAWIRENAERLGVAPRRIGLLGNSAGGTLAAFAAVRDRGATDAGRRVRAVVSWSGPMELRSLARSLAADPERATMVSDYLGCDPDRCRGRASAASPVTHVDPSDPPILLAGSLDEFIPPDQARRMSDELRLHGVSRVLVLLPGRAHAGGFESRIWDATLGFLRSRLAPRPG